MEFQRIDNEGVLMVFLLEAVRKTRKISTERGKRDTRRDSKSDDNVKMGGAAGLYIP